MVELRVKLRRVGEAGTAAAAAEAEAELKAAVEEEEAVAVDIVWASSKLLAWVRAR